MLAAATAWDLLATGLESFSRGYRSLLSRLHGEGWSGSAAEAMAGAVAPYAAWATTARAQAEDAGRRIRAAVAAYEAALGAMVPPSLVTANRTRLATLVETNIFGQNTTMIGVTEAAYQEMWAQDVAAMYQYAASSAAAATLTPFSDPPQTTSAAGQSAAVCAAVSSSTAGFTQSTLAQLTASAPQQLQALAGAGISSTSAPWQELESLLLKLFSDFNTFVGPINLADGLSRTYTSAGSYVSALLRSSAQSAGTAAAAAQGAAKAASTAAASASTPGAALLTTGSATSVGALSVPQSWAVTASAASSATQPNWLSEAAGEAGPSWHEVSDPNVWHGVPSTGVGSSPGSSLRPTVSNALRVAPRKFQIPRPAFGG
ncbi:putative PPE family protein PPE29 [Mycobacterium basiliense]|uniref:Putative PPE family protein PPE29 n=2 Tax=Mycobacterium basiliense TaxID=2094119 RepID=A0A447GKY1_9MYCO|nr:putative PPE family protein PPE29 [Mycobacterium basiliense]